jgi:hypothetical protein
MRVPTQKVSQSESNAIDEPLNLIVDWILTRSSLHEITAKRNERAASSRNLDLLLRAARL